MANWIDCGTYKVNVRSVPGFGDLGAVPIEGKWRIVVLETMGLIGPQLDSYGLLCSYAEETYRDQYD